MKTVKLFAAIWLFAIIGLNTSWAHPISHLRVIWHDNPTSEAIIAWTTDKKNKDAVVYYDVAPRNGKLKLYKNKMMAKDKMYTATTDWRNHVELTKLKAATNYYFVIVSGGAISDEYYFQTAPQEMDKFNLLFGGDSRSDRSKRREVNRLIYNLRKQNPHILGLIHGGDYVESGLSWKLWKDWLDDYQLTNLENGRVLPIVPTRGNHEYLSPLYNDIFVRPGDKLYKNYYRTKIGNLSILTLNTNICHHGKQKKWLIRELEKASKESKWIVANYHRPAWPAVKKEGRALKHWVPLFEKYQVDLVFESDGHVLKKTVPILDGKRNDEKGIIYVGEGGMGVPQRVPKKADLWYLQSPGYAVSNHHMQMIEVNDSQISYTVHLLDGMVFDQMYLNPRSRL